MDLCDLIELAVVILSRLVVNIEVEPSEWDLDLRHQHSCF